MMAVVEGTLKRNKCPRPGLDVYDYHALEEDGEEIIYLLGPVDRTEGGTLTEDVPTNNQGGRPRVLGIFEGLEDTDKRGRATKISYRPINSPAKKRRLRQEIPNSKLPQRSRDREEERNTIPDIDDSPPLR